MGDYFKEIHHNGNTAQVDRMNNEIRNEIMFHISNQLDMEVDEKQLMNMVQEEENCYQLRAYGKLLRFNKDDGSLMKDG